MRNEELIVGNITVAAEKSNYSLVLASAFSVSSSAAIEKKGLLARY